MELFLCFSGIVLIVLGLVLFINSKNNTTAKSTSSIPLVPSATDKPKQNSSYEKKGITGEITISQLLAKLPGEYHIFNDLLISSGLNYVQIDHIVVSLNGIFCIETKNWKGEIFGSANSEQWTQQIPGKVNYYYNPLQQNKTHIDVLQKYLSYNNAAPIFSIIVFASDAKLKITNCKEHEAVLTRDELLGHILLHKKELMNDEQLSKTLIRISNANVTDTTIRQEHINIVKEKALKAEHYDNTRYCPKCGSPLVLKTGKGRAFWSCSAFPNCKYSESAHSL